jgi:predicted acetyltransferase
MCADVIVRPLEADDIEEFSSVVAAAFGGHPDPRKSELLADLHRGGRRHGAFAGDRLVGTAGAFAFDMTVPGGAAVPVAGVTAVGVASTHRRRGILRQLMTTQLDDVAHAGESVAILTASESGIYRRFGYGVASFQTAYELASRRIEFREPVGADLDLVLLRGTEAESAVKPIYDRWASTRAGAIAYTPAWWRATLGQVPNYIGGGPTFVVVCEPQQGRGGGYAIYTTDPPDDIFTVKVRQLVAEDPVVEARLWRYLVEIDLSERVHAEQVPVDCLLRWWVVDLRQVRTTVHRDWLHVRILDVPAALTGRRYPVDGELRIEVSDGFRPGPATDGRFGLAVRDGEGRCEPTAAEPDLVLDIAALGSLYLGGVRATDLAAAGLVTERTTGALARADALLGWPSAPFCPTHF